MHQNKGGLKEWWIFLMRNFRYLCDSYEYVKNLPFTPSGHIYQRGKPHMLHHSPRETQGE